MRSYILAAAVAMLLSAIYAFQNTAEITVRFLIFQRALPQGVWEVIVFTIGAFLMWFFSVLASYEINKKYSADVKERDKRIAELEEERKSLLTAFNNIAPGADPFGKPWDDSTAHETFEEEPGSEEQEIFIEVDETPQADGLLDVDVIEIDEPITEETDFDEDEKDEADEGEETDEIEKDEEDQEDDEDEEEADEADIEGEDREEKKESTFV